MKNLTEQDTPQITQPQQELQQLQAVYEKLVHHPTTGFTAEQLTEHRTACKEALAAKRKAVEKLRLKKIVKDGAMPHGQKMKDEG